MAKLPGLKRLMLEDFPEQKGWIGKLLDPLNLFMEQVYSALSRNLTIAENMNQAVLTVRVKEGVATPTTPYYVKNTTKSKPLGVVITNSTDEDQSGYSGPLGLLWEYVDSSNQIKINTIYGLKTSSGTYYVLTLFVHTN